MGCHLLHPHKRCLLLGRKVMTNLDSIFKSRDITLPTKVHLVQAMVFPIVMYECESWIVKKAEHQRIDGFELWYWRRFLRVPWTARRSNQSLLKEISPTSLSLFTFMHWRRKRQPTPVFLPGESQGQERLVGNHLWGRTELITTKAT